jgi:hypothetical protein
LKGTGSNPYIPILERFARLQHLRESPKRNNGLSTIRAQAAAGGLLGLD